MGITVKTARIALLLTVLSILGFGAVPLQAQSMPNGWTYNELWSGNGASNRYSEQGHGGVAYWFDSLYFTRTQYTGNNDPGFGPFSGYHYSNWTSNWTYSGSWGHLHINPYDDINGDMMINSTMFSDGTTVNVYFNHGTEKNINVNRPVGTGEIANNDPNNIEIRSILINGGDSWSYHSSTDVLRIIHGTGSLFLYDNINLTTSNVQFDFDEGVRVHEAGTIYIADGNSRSPFGIYMYNATPAKRDWRTLFVENVNGTNPNVTITRSVNTNQQSGWQNRTYMDTNSRMTFTYDKGVKFEIFNVDNSAAPVNDPILGGAFYLNNGADIRKGLAVGSSDYYGLLDVYGNKARNGAAFYSEQYLTIEGNTRIHGNAATSTSNTGSSVIGGGAIFMAGKYYPGRLTFDTSHGHIALYDNHENNGTVGTNANLNSIFLAKDTLLEIKGEDVYTGNLYIEDGISTGLNNALSYGNNSMTVDLRGQGGQFVQFGALSSSLLNPSSSNGGSVRIINGPFRVLHGGEFRTKGLSATFTIERNDTNGTVGILAGQGLVGAEQGIIVNGILSPDSKNYVIPARVNDSLADNEVKDDGTGTDIGYMTLEGNVLLNGSTIKYDTTPTAAALLNNSAPPAFSLNNADSHVLNADLIRVNEISGIADTGKIMLSVVRDNDGKIIRKNTIDLGTSWNPSNSITGGKYVIASSLVGIVDAADNNIAVTSDNIMDYFNEIVPATISQTQNKRAGGSLFVERGLLDTTVTTLALQEYDIVLQTTNQGNVNLIWTGKTSAQWNDPAVNWIRRVKKTDGTILNIDLDFEDGDFVTFNEPDNIRGENVIVISGWTVGGMRVEGGNYHFTGGAITGQANRNFIGIQATGRMDILSAAAAPTKIFFEQENNFEKGTLITGTGAEITIGRDQVFGTYGSNTSALETGAIYLDNASAKFITSDGLTGDRFLKNHIELIGNSDLTLDIPDGTKLTISGVDTSTGIGFAGHHGGALFVDAGAKFQRTTNQLLTFEQNIADEGGAIFGIDTLKITGNTLFSQNAAVNYGGAVYFDTLLVARGDLTFDTADGDIVFDGNYTNTDLNNGIYLKGQTKLTINTVNGHNLFLNDSIDFDPITSGNNWLVKTGEGFVQFTGLNKFDTNLGGSNNGRVEVQNGEFRLAQNGLEPAAEFRTGSYASSAYIAVANGAKIAGNGTFNVNTTRAFAYEFGNGSIIAPDSAVFTSALTGTDQTSTAGHEIGQLTLAGNGTNGNVKLTGSIIDIDLGNGSNPANSPGVNGDYILVTNGNIQLTGTDNKVEVRSVPSTAPAGDYLIVHASGLLTSGTSNNTVAELKKHIDSNLDPSGSSARGGTGTLAFGLNGAIVGDASNANELWIVGYSAGDNMKLYWTGKYDTKWDEASTKNWHVLSPSSSESDFYQYDYVTFDDTVAGVTVANHNAVLTGGDKNVTGMDVVNGSFTVTSGNGGNYKIVNNKYGSAMAGAPSGKLIVGGGTSAAELTLGLETQFVEGTELRDNSKITIGNDKALGTYNNANFTAFTDNGTAVTGSKTGYVDVTGDAVIAAAEDHAVVNRFHVAANKSLKVDVAADKKLTVNNVTTSAGTNAQGVVVLENGAKLEKTGSGNLVFTGNTGSETVRVNGASATIAASAGDIIFNINTQPAIQAGTGSKTTLTGNTDSRIYLGDTVNVYDFSLNGGVTAVIKNTATIAGNTTIGDGASAGVLFVDNSNFNAAGTFELLRYATVAGNGNVRGNGGVTLKGTVDPTSDSYSVANGLIAKNAVNPISQTLTFIGNTTLDGAVLKIDLGAANSGIADVIHVTGNISLTADKSTISFTPAGTPDGEYKILEATGTFLVGANIDAMSYFNTAGSSNRLSGYELKFRNSGSDVTAGPVNELWLVGYDAPSSMDLYWTGKNGTATDPNWMKRDMTKLNWRDTGATALHFLDNDHVYFTGDTWVQTRAVKLADDDTYNVNAMDVTGGVYTFDPVGAGTATKIVSAAGDLTVNGNASATFNVALEFANLNVGGATVTLNKGNTFTTVNLGGTSTVTLGNEKGLGDNNTVNVAGDAVLKSTVNGNLNNSFVLAGNLTIDTDKNLTLNKALTGTGNFVKDNTGLVEFVAASNITGNTAIKKGEVKFDANYASIGTFTLDTGATVSPGSNTTTVTANQFNLKGTVSVDRTSKMTFVSLNPVAFDGATLAVDLTSANTTASLINVNGAATINGNANVIDIGMDAAWTDTDYIIVATTGGIKKASDGLIPSTTELGQMFTLKQGGATISNTRQTYEVKLNPADTNLLLHLNLVNNEALYWNGSPTNDWSNGNNANWYEAPNTSASKAVFVAGDFVNFQSNLAAETSVKVGDNQYMTAGMVIDSGNYTFENGALKNGAIGGNMTTGNYASKTGKMEINNTGTVQFDVATHFVNGIEIKGDRTIKIGNDLALGNTASSNGSNEGLVNIAAGKNVTIETIGDRSINNRIVVDSGASLNLVARDGSLNIDNPNGSTVELNGAKLTVDAAEGYHVAFDKNIEGTGSNEFLKTGAGDVAFTGANNLGTGSTATIANGKMILENTADSLLVGTFKVNSGATLTGNGTVTASNTTFAAGAIIDPKSAIDRGILTLTGNTTFDGVTYLVQLDGTSDSDKIVTNNVSFTGNNEVEITVWSMGTYDIITASGTMTGSNNWTVSPSQNPRAGASIQQVTKGGLEVLELNTTIANAHLTWTGSSNLNWDGTTMNWTNNDNLGQQDVFMNGDAVFFTGAGQGNVDVTAGLQIGDMTITNGNYNFRGEITGLKGNSTLSDAKGMLNITGGQTTFNNNVNFAGGINVTKGSVTLANDGKLISGKDIVFGTGTTLSFTPVTGIITAAGKVELNGNIKFGIPATNDVLDVIIAGVALDVPHLKSIFSTTSGLNARLATFSDNNKRMSLTYSQITPSEFADINNLGWNEREAAKGITNAIKDGLLDEFEELENYLYSLDSDAQVEAILDQFRGTEMAADALTASLWEPWQKVYKQLRTRGDYIIPSHAVNGQAPKFKGRDVWIEGYYRYLDVNGDRNAKKYYEKRGGMVMGLDANVNHHSTLGISFGYGNPELYTKFGQVKTNDFTLALYGKTQIQSDVYLNIYGGIGFQNYEYKRYETLADYTSQYNGDYDGNSAYISAEVYKPYKWNEAWTLFPLAALDYQRAWSSGFEENGGLFNQKIYKSNVDRFVARIGLDSKLQYSDSVNFLTRLQYGFMMGGDTRASLNTSFVGTGTTMNMRGVHLGRSQIDMGIGGEWYLDQRKCLKFFGDYDLNFGAKSSAQTGQLGLVVQW